MSSKKQPSEKEKPSKKLWDETVADAYLLAKRLAERESCAVTRSKFNKHFREGGKIEMALRIYVSEDLLDEAEMNREELKEISNKGAWWTVRDRLRTALKKAGGNPRWEHVVPVRDCIDQCIEKAKEADEESFKHWFNQQITQGPKPCWCICLITEDEDKKLKTADRDPNNLWKAYDHAEIKHVSLVREALIP